MATVVFSCVRFASGDSIAVGGHTKNKRTEETMARVRNEADPNVQEQRGLETAKAVIEKVVSFGRSVPKSSSGVENGVKSAGQQAARAASGGEKVAKKYRKRDVAKKSGIVVYFLALFALATMGVTYTIKSGIP
ncbi:unnamed protein product [Hyaloperonospora brassicae]|uniref:Transmembrane protein n=1 Tax=Hyaloperonospora brassicae TaxID=162125 RepID=A0AAV0URZ8_HYABA|nr:unnamed protein product [Hyaloperonospora brassicae]